MDAAESDYDAKLYKASGDIIPELQVKLPLLIWHLGDRSRLRTHVLFTKCEQIKNLLDRFQEWPQLLDPVLAALVQTIVDGFLSYVASYADTYAYPTDPSAAQAIPLPLALSRLLYTLCKVRGYKVIVRLLNNEPRYVAPMLSCMRQWEESREKDSGISIVWEEKYIMLLWLSHLMLAPFELSTLSTLNDPLLEQELQELARDLPEVAIDVLSLGFQYINSPSKERESAVILLVRLALRRDMQYAGLSRRLVDYTTQKLLQTPAQRHDSVYHAIGHLSLLYALMALGTDLEVAPFLTKVFRASVTLSTSPEEHHATIRGSAPARKLLVKLQRVCLTHAIALTDTTPNVTGDSVNQMLEEGIQNYLDALGDKDTPVRMAASKALSIVALKLDANMAAEIVDAVLGGLAENILVEDPGTGRSMAKSDLPTHETLQMKRNISLVDPLKWHGLMLTLGHLLFRRSPPPYQLADIIESLLVGLEFEQRSNVGTSVGNGVRDAACFGIWALSRKYSTSELESIEIGDVAAAMTGTKDATSSALQLIAIRLVLSACFDPSGNIRRGSSAALQELIGRHPDTILEGIPVVQVVDYQAVARRSRAMTEVSVQAADLHPVYHEALINALLDWRGARAADPDSRRWASVAMRSLCERASPPHRAELAKQVLRAASKLRARNLGATAGSRHGLLLGAGAIIATDDKLCYSDSFRSELNALTLRSIAGDLKARATNDLEMVIEAVAVFCTALQPDGTIRQEILSILNDSIIISTKRRTVDACAEAVAALFKALNAADQASLLRSWTNAARQKRAEMVSKGRLVALSHLHKFTVSRAADEVSIVAFLADIVVAQDPIETRTIAMESLLTVGRDCPESGIGMLDFPSLQKALEAGLNDYTNDQRGDIGSLLRLASLDVVEILCRFNLPQISTLLGIIAPNVVRLAAEKLNKVRHRASSCLRVCWSYLNWEPHLGAGFQHLADISSEEYFRQLLPLLIDKRVQTQLILGLASSAAGTTEEIGRACCAALTAYVLQQHKPENRSLRLGLLSGTLSCLDTVAAMEDNHVIPMLDFFTFVIEQNLVPVNGSEIPNQRLWDVVQKVHSPTSTMERIEALIRFYGALLVFPGLKTRALDKLTRQLLHRYPRIRNAAADVLYLSTNEDILIKRDWNGAAASNKPHVLDLRKTLKIVRVG